MDLYPFKITWSAEGIGRCKHRHKLQKIKAKFYKSYIISIVIFLIAVSLTAAVSAATYYVDAVGGLDTNNGTSSLTPWQTITKVNGSTFKPGDYILFLSGDIWNGAQLVPPSSGSAGNVITFGSYGTGNNPIIDGTSAVNEPLNINAVNYITISNLSFKNGSNTGQGVIFIQGGANYITIQNCQIGPSNQHGVQLQHNAGSDIRILNNQVFNNAHNGISSYIHTGASAGHEVVVQGNTVYNNAADGISIRANYWIVQNNIVHDNGGAASYIGIHAYTSSSSEGVGLHNIIRYNTVYNQRGTGQDGAGIAIDQWCNKNVISFNIAFHNDGPGIYLYDAQDCQIINNTVYDNCQDSSGQLNQKGEIRLTSSDEPNALTNNAVVTNNIAYATTAGTYAIYFDNNTVKNKLSITNNDWYRSSGNWFIWANSGGNDIVTWNKYSGGNDLNADPRFANASQHNFSLLSDSPCISSGVSMGAAQVIAIDIGAIQFKAPGAPILMR